MANLVSNVHVDGVWYGPDYPNNEVTDEVAAKITNPAAFDETASAPAFGGLAFRADDFAGLSTDAAAEGPAVATGDVPDDDANVDQVLAWVGDDAQKASMMLARENSRAKGPRSSLVSALEKTAGA